MNLFKSDLIRFYGKDCLTMKELLLFPYELRWLWPFRMASKYKRNKFLFLPFYILYRHYTKVSQIQVPIGTKIGAGFYIGHVGRIIINPRSVLGKNINIATGVTIGQTNRGRMKGAPTISDNVWIETNAVIVGNVTIGTDVLIAPNTYINQDIPSHSVVFGNPCVIKSRPNAKDSYINNTI